jgi:hypothetical protein
MHARDVLIDLLDEAYDKVSWHGPNLRGALRGVQEREADWRPPRGRHSIRELTVHAAYWKYRVRRRLSGNLEAEFAVPGSNWFTRHPSRSWKQELQLLAEEHRRLREAVIAFPSRQILKPLLPNGTTAAHLIRGIAAHDLYHAGQIQMLKRMLRSR